MIAPAGSRVSTSISSVTASITSIVIAAGKTSSTRMATTGSFGDGDAACPVKIGRRGSLGRGLLRRLDKAMVARRRLSDASVVHHPTWTRHVTEVTYGSRI